MLGVGVGFDTKGAGTINIMPPGSAESGKVGDVEVYLAPEKGEKNGGKFFVVVVHSWRESFAVCFTRTSWREMCCNQFGALSLCCYSGGERVENSGGRLSGGLARRFEGPPRGLLLRPYSTRI